MKNIALSFACALTLILSASPARAADKAMTELTWFGHASFRVVTPKGKTIWIDPWLKNPVNPEAQNGKDPIAGAKADYILLTHGHFDHVGDTVALATKTKARLVSNFELGKALVSLHGFPQDQLGFDTQMNIGGTIKLGDGEVSVHMTPAVHSSGVDTDEGKETAYGGNPGGYVIVIAGGPTIYHSGDTAYFSDMKLIGQDLKPDVALVNIGGHFGMEPDMAVRAARDLRSGVVIPHHYKTFPILTQDPGEFEKQLKGRVRVLQPGQSVRFEGKKPLK